MIQACNIDARIAIDRMEIIFATEDLISDGVMLVEEDVEIIKEARVVIISEQSLYKMRKNWRKHNRYVKRIESKNIPLERKETLISPGRDTILVSEVNNTRQVDQ
jgi:NTE family protein